MISCARIIVSTAWRKASTSNWPSGPTNFMRLSEERLQAESSRNMYSEQGFDDSACNLSSLNLMKFVGPDGQFDVEAFRHAVDTLILAQEIIVDNASYPTERIGENSHNFRPLGLGFANLGALLMSMGIPYDSDQGRDFAGAITAVMCGQAYLTSSRVAAAVGTFTGY